MRYNHRNHVGNAGDVWKHLILAEVAEYLLAKEKNLVYLESHVGYPKYSLEKPGEWQDGIGECWKHLDVLKEFSYFGILENMNPSGLMNYPGSAVLVLMAATRAGFGLKADVWDINPEVAAPWNDITLLGSNKLCFHLGDGFSGVRSLMDRSEPALLLIDPSYLEIRDVERAMDLLERAAKSGWTVLWWQMTDVDAIQDICCNFELYSVNFPDVGMSCGKWRVATMTVVGDDDLQDWVNRLARSFHRIMQNPEPI